MKSADESAVISQSCNGISQAQDDSDRSQQHSVVAADKEAVVVDLKKSSLEDSNSPADLDDEIPLQASEDLAALGQNGSCQLWLYKCVLDGCSAAFELLADLRTHFICHHQAQGMFLKIILSWF